MKNMKMDKEEANEYSSPSMAKDAPQYPYGLQITLDDSSLEKLGIGGLLPIGSVLEIRAKVEVCSASEYKSQDGEAEKKVTLQITDMELGPPDKNAAKELYG